MNINAVINLLRTKSLAPLITSDRENILTKQQAMRATGINEKQILKFDLGRGEAIAANRQRDS